MAGVGFFVCVFFKLWPPGDILNFMEQDFKNVRAVYKTLSYLWLPRAGELHTASAFIASHTSVYLYFYLRKKVFCSLILLFLLQRHCCHGDPAHLRSITVAHHGTAQPALHTPLSHQEFCELIV